LWVWSK